MKNKKYQTIETVPNSNIKIVETKKKLSPLTHMTAHFPGFGGALQ